MAMSGSFGAFLQTCKAREKDPVEWTCSLCCALATDNEYIFASERGEIASLEETADRDIPHKYSSTSDIIPAKVVALARIGATCTSGLESGAIQVWNCITGKEIACHVIEQEALTCLGMLSEGECMFGLASGKVGLWRYGLDKHSILEGNHSASLTCMGITSDLKCVTAGKEGTVVVWTRDKASNQYKIQTRLQGHEGGISCLLILSPSQYVSGSQDTVIKVWDSGSELASLKGHCGAVTCLVLLNLSVLASGSEDKTVRIWSVSTMMSLSTLEGHEGAVTCLGVTSQKICVSGDSAGWIRLWDAVSWEGLAAFKGHSEAVTCLAVANNYCLTGSSDCKIHRWNFTQKKIKTFVGNFEGVKLIGGYRDARCVLYQGTNSVLHWDISKSSLIRSFEVEDANCMAEIDQDQYILGGEGCITILDTSTGQRLVKFDNVPELIRCVASLNDGRFILGASDKTLRIWSVALETEVRVLRGHDGIVECVAVSRDSKRCVSGSGDYTLREWDLTTYKHLGVIGSHEAIVTSVVMLGSTKCASAAWDQTLYLWDITQRSRLIALNELAGKLEYVLCLAVAGRNLLLSGSSDGTVRVWNTTKRLLVSTIHDHSAAVRSLAVFQDRYLSAASDGTVCQRDICEYFPFNSKSNLLEIEAHHLTRLIQGEIGVWAKSFRIREAGVNALHVLAYYNHADKLATVLRETPMLRGYFGSPLSLAIQRKTMGCVEEILQFCIEMQKSVDEMQASVRIIAADIPELLGCSCPSLAPFFAVLMQRHPDYVKDSFLCLSRSIPFTEYVEEFKRLEEREGEEELLQVQISMLKWNLASGSNESLALLKAVANCAEKKVLSTCYVESIITLKWNQQWLLILGNSVVYSLLWVLLLLSLFKPALWAVWSFLILNLVLLGWKATLKRNIKLVISPAEWTCRLSSLCWALLLITEHAPAKWLTVLVLMMALLQSCWIFLAFEATRGCVCVIVQVVEDLSGFLALLSYLAVSVGTLAVYLSDEAGSLQSAWESAYNVTIDTLEWTGDQLIAAIALIGVIILVSLFVSLICQAYTKSQKSFRESYLRLQLEKVLESELMLFWQRQSGRPTFVLTVKPAA